MTGAIMISTALLFMFGYLAIDAWRGPRRGPGLAQRFQGEELRNRLLKLGDKVRAQEPKEAAAIKQQLAQAGYRSDDAPAIFQAIRLLSMGIGVTLGFVLWQALDSSTLFVIFAGGGYVLPSRFLETKQNERRLAFERGLPETVDVLVNCMDAGLGFEQALARVTQELYGSQPIIADEFQVVVREFETAMPVPESMRRLAKRVAIEEVETLCAVIGQASELGVPMGPTMREYAAAARRKRLSNLDESVGKATAKVTFPLLFCLIPASLLVVIGPTILSLIKFFSRGIN